jgi:hypothetical protein
MSAILCFMINSRHPTASSLRGAKRRGNPVLPSLLDCRASLAGDGVFNVKPFFNDFPHLFFTVLML